MMSRGWIFVFSGEASPHDLKTSGFWADQSWFCLAQLRRSVGHQGSFSMSKPIFAAILAMGAAVCLAAPAEARIDNGPVSSLYENDGRALPKQAQKHRSKKHASARRAGSKKIARKSGKSYGKSTGAVGRKARLAGRS